jgi:hypothetical protein
MAGGRVGEHAVAHAADAVEELCRIALGLAQDQDANALLEDGEPESEGEGNPREPHAPGLEDDGERGAGQGVGRRALERPEVERDDLAVGLLDSDVAL